MRRTYSFAILCLTALVTTAAVGRAADLSFKEQAVALDTLERGHAAARWYTTLQTTDGPVRFGELVVEDDAGEMDTDRRMVPLVGKVRGVTDAALQLTDRDGRNLAWAFVAQGRSDSDIWGVLDAMYGEPNPALTIVRSTDSGATWTTQLLPKPNAQAEFVGMSLEPAGNARIVLFLPREAGGLQPGYYAYASTDGGITWAGGKRDVDDDGQRRQIEDLGVLRSPLKRRKVRAEYFGGAGWVYCYRPICRPYGWDPDRPPNHGNPIERIEPSIHDQGRLKAMENPGFDDRMERGKVPARFDITPKAPAGESRISR